jgi:hypothetical protein
MRLIPIVVIFAGFSPAKELIYTGVKINILIRKAQLCIYLTAGCAFFQ